MNSPNVSSVRFTPARELDVALGLIGWISVDIEGLRVDGIALRRTGDGRLDLRYPSRPRSYGGHAIVRPVDDATRRSIEGQILGALRALGVAA